MADRLLFPPTTFADICQRGWDAPDFVYVSGDAYVDHPSFGAAVIVRTLGSRGVPCRGARPAELEKHQRF